QLIAESLGKQGRGVLPVADAPPHAEEGPDRQAFDTTAVGARAPEDLGRLCFVTEVATAIAGHELGVNPFDQPDVQAAKDATSAVLASPPVPSVPDADDEALGALLHAQPPAYLALLAFVQPSPAFDEAAAGLRTLLQEHTGCATTFGYGPRYLHSTGQLHKGGPPTGRFLQVIHRPTAEIEIPGAGHTFETLKRAQALGDLRTLRDRGRPAERIELEGDDPAAALSALTERIATVLRG
ncbi:MAG: glucose-6-phosphate isomerase, partial [Actinomycetota bacterium]|nr:glucose-6-phosphate isomerase [Actinomycetota bacterium]